MSKARDGKVLIQAAIDIVDLEAAFRVAADAVEAGVDWIEVGHPLVLFYGMDVIRQFAERFPSTYILVDMMVMAGTRKYAKGVKAGGGHNITIYGGIPEYSIEDAVKSCREEGVEVTIDLFNVKDALQVAKVSEKAGAEYVMVHFGIDQHKFEPDASPVETLKLLRGQLSCRLSYATYGIGEAVAAVEAGTDVIVQGYPVFGADGTREGMKEFVAAVRQAEAKFRKEK
jgi:3-keto-L-gulonate-6-phosphate decarboxylase